MVDPRIIHPQVVPGNVSLSAHCWAPCLCGEDEDTDDTEDTALTSGKLKRHENGIRRGDRNLWASVNDTFTAWWFGRFLTMENHNF